MSDALKLELAREIYPDSKRAGRSSFSTVQWSGVERAWEWIGKNYTPQEPPMKQDNDTPPWTAEQREAADDVMDVVLEEWQRPHVDSPMMGAYCAAIAKVAPLFVSTPSYEDRESWTMRVAEAAQKDFQRQIPDATEHVLAAVWHSARRAALHSAAFVSPPPVPSVEECQAAYSEGLNRCNRTIDEAHTAGIAAVRALFVQGDGDGPHQGEGFARPTSQTLDTGARRAEAADESLVESARACEPLATPKKGREDARKPDSKTVDEGGSAPSPAPAPVSHPGKPDNCPAPAPDREAVAWGSMIIKARKELDRLCQDTRGWRMSIPADHTRDSDLIFDDALRCAENEIRTRDERIATITKERDEARNNRIAATAEWQRAVAAVIATLTRERDEARGKARSVTREDAISLAVELMLPDKEIVDALRAIGFEVVG